ncbi:MAG: ABC transporter ATP-binding protein [Verrucomicrobiota bacterium]
MSLSVEKLVKRYSGEGGSVVTAVDGVSFEVGDGEFVALYGPSGCGKSTLMLMAGGLLSPDEGTVLIGGDDPYGLSAGERARFRAERVGFVFQQFYLIPYLDVLDNVLVCELAGAREDAGLRGRAEELLEKFHLSDRLHHVPSALSVGEQQRVALARAMLREPGLILADEPTGNLDPENAAILLDHLKGYARGGGAVLMVTHDEKAREEADRAVKLEAGVVV